jgi:malate dehydrogenase (oxaloacetate-decarboxylating)(NADP+)
LGLRLDFNKEARILDPQADREFFAPLTERYQRMVERRGVQPESAARWIATRHGIAAAMLLEAGEVDAALCGGLGDWTRQLQNILPIIPRQRGVSRLYSLSALILPNGALFFCDTHVNVDPTAEQIAEMTQLAAKSVRRFGLAPKAALLSHSSFGTSHSPSAIKMRKALSLLRAAEPDFEIDGEMHADAALSDVLRARYVSNSPLTGSANLMVMPTLDAANIALTLLSAATEALLVGPLLLGVAKPVHVMVPSVTARGIVNMTALAVAQAGAKT